LFTCCPRVEEPSIKRLLEPEWMDDPRLDAGMHRRALVGLARLNRLSRSAQILWPEVRELVRENKAASLSILDVACGAGDVTIKLWQQAARAGLNARVTGCDLSPRAVEYAAERARRAKATVDFQQCDVFAKALPPGYDVVLCSLFLHHQTEAKAIELLRRMAHAARQLVLVNDLLRTPTGYALAWLATRLATRSPVVHADGPQSVAAAFTLQEAADLGRQAGMNGAIVRRRWPCRFLLSWRKPA
jgi:2-polyprenyl-3-methyl-5-hydroxy-6-metoxy-1,4-benzoquinol methylase